MEDEIDNFKGGTIRSITEEYLQNFDSPLHISLIAEHVVKFRPATNFKSIYYNLRIQEAGVFSFFENSHIGLTSKIYDGKYISIESNDKQSWEDRYKTLEDFIGQNNKLPRSSGCPQEEEGLYRWLSVQKGKCIKGLLDSNKTTLLKKLMFEFPELTKTRETDSIVRYQKLHDFIRKHKRLPNASNDGEQPLYRFYYKQRKLYNAAELTNEEIIKYNLINEEIKSLKYENS